MERRVVITGMGIYSCIGVGKEAVAESLYEGRSGIGIVPGRHEFGYRSALSGLLPHPDLKGKLDRRPANLPARRGTVRLHRHARSARAGRNHRPNTSPGTKSASSTATTAAPRPWWRESTRSAKRRTPP